MKKWERDREENKKTENGKEKQKLKRGPQKNEKVNKEKRRT